MNAIALLLAFATFAQEPARPPEAPPPAVQAADYRVGPGDVLSVNVTGVREFDQSITISNSGRMRVPYVGIMFVAGMTPHQIELEVARLIKQHELVTEPSVRVQVQRYRAQPLYVVGEVTTPGQFIISGEMRLLDLVGKAGGLLPSAATKGMLYRRRSVLPGIEARVIAGMDPRDEAQPPVPSPAPASEGAPDEQSLTINLDELRDGGRPELNIKLQGGDVLYVPRRRPQNFYIIGDVITPGPYTLPRQGVITAAQAVIYAGGTLATAKSGKGFLMRHDEQGVRQAMPVDFKAIIAGKQPDFEMRPDDIIFIPNSPVKTVAVGLLNMIPVIIQQWLIF